VKRTNVPDDATAELVRQGLATAPRAPLDVGGVLEAKLPRLPAGISASRLIAAEREFVCSDDRLSQAARAEDFVVR